MDSLSANREMACTGGASLPSTCPDARKRRVSYFYEPTIGDYDYGEHHPMKPKRIRMAHNLIQKYDLHRRMEINRPFPAAVDHIRGFHSPEYVEFLSSVSPNILPTKKHARSLKRFNFGDDCPVFDGLFDFCQASAGGSIGAAVKLNRNDADIAINWGGGLHHAMKNMASGFCYVNDIVLGILELLKQHRRVLYVDIDIHHGDGVEEAFYETDRVMTVSFHKFGGGFFPKTGKIKDVGKALGKYYALNVPLKDGLNDENFRSLFRPIMQKVMDVYQPEAVVLQCGADSLSGDQLGSFNLSVKGHAECLRFLRSFNVPLMVLGGGGYTLENVARCWCYETAVAVDVELDNKLPYNAYYKSFGPDYTLHMKPSNMKNLNKRKDLEKIRNTLLDQLSKLQHAPSTQFQTMPPTTQVPDQREEEMEVRPKSGIWNGERDYESDEDEIEKPMRSLHSKATYGENTELSNTVDLAAQTDTRFNNIQHKVDNMMVGKAEELIEVEERATAAQIEAGRVALEAQVQAAKEALNSLKESPSQEILKTIAHRESEILKKAESCLDTLRCGAESLQQVAEYIRNDQPYIEERLDQNQINLTRLSIRLNDLKKKVDAAKKGGTERKRKRLV